MKRRLNQMDSNYTPDRAVQHSGNDLHGQPLPLRHPVRCLLAGGWIIAAITIMTFPQGT